MEAAARSDVRTAEGAVDKRIEGILAWLEENAPEVFNEQRHVVEGTAERTYWHYGYMVALRDVRELLLRPKTTN